jgi:lysophospholipase L1-like esterase
LLAVAVLCFPTIRRLYKAPHDVAFLGDSLTQGWAYPQANFGIFGNTTAQMAGRFETQIAGHPYKKVVILGGTNDVLLGINPSETIHNLEGIAEKAEREGAQPVLCEIPPIFHSYNLADKTDYSNKVRALNQQIASLAAGHRWQLIDYYDPILGHPDYSSDGVHMKRRGYAVMEWTFLRELQQ